MTTAAQPQAGAKLAELVPYVFFYGRCEEALKFYADLFRGKYELQRVREFPEMGAQMPAEAQNRVMHAKFTAPGIAFMASDGMDDKPVDPDAGNVSLALTSPDRAEGDRVFTALAEGGKIERPLGEAPWGGRFGVVDDRFGNQWLVASP